MEVTSDLSCGVSQLSNCHTMDCLDNEPRLFVLTSSYLMLFPKCGHLLAERPGARVSARVLLFFFSHFLICFFLSAPNVNCVLYKAAIQGLLNTSRYY